MRARTAVPALVLAAVAAVLAAVVAAAGPLAASAGAAGPRAPRAAPQPLRTFSSCTSLVRFARARAQGARRSAGMGGPPPPRVLPAPAPSGAPGSEDESAMPVSAAPAAGADVSTTNVQEAGVDEPDLVKTDGERIFAVARGRLHAVEARGDSPALVGSIELPGGFEHDLLLHEGRALVISRGPGEVAAESRPAAGGPITTLTEVDVRDPSAMRVVRTLRADGFFVSARRTGPTARVVLSAPPELATMDARAVRTAPLATWIPGGVVRTERTGRRRGRRLVDCSAVRRPRAFSGLGILTVLTIDLRRGLPWVDADAVMTDAQVVYGSPASLYVATEDWDAAQRRATTQIHRFAAADAPDTAYAATGAVPGSLLNQFALSEHAGVLRVASTVERPGDGAEPFDSESVVTVLDQDGSTLRPVGSVGGLGRGERIFAVRFLGDVGYVVTFRQTDPLYTLDLATPTAPRVVGELKIRGYSAYLHPVGEDLLLGVGQDATEEGRVLGTQLSLFDVSRPEAPVRLHARTLAAAGSSEAEYDHHAFLHWAPAQLAVLPFEAGGGPGTDLFAGAAGFRVDPGAGIEEVGRVEHRGPFGVAQIRRSLVIGERLFTLSERGVLASDLATLAPRAWVPFAG